MRRTYLICVLGVLVGAVSAMAQRSFRETYRVSIEIPSRAVRNATEEHIWTFRVTDRNGAPVTEVIRAMPVDVAAPEPVMFENGRLLLLHSFDAYAELFGSSGELLKRMPLLDRPTPDYERVVRSAVHASQVIVGVSSEGQGVRIISIDDQGVLTVRKQLEAMMITGVAVASDPSLIAVGTVSWKESEPAYATTFDAAGAAWIVPKGFTTGEFRDAETFYGRNDRTVSLVSIGNRQLRWSEDVPAGRMIVDAAVTSDGITVLTADKPKWLEGGWIYSGPRLRTRDDSGKIVDEQALPTAGFAKGAVDVEQGRTVVRLDGRIVK